MESVSGWSDKSVINNDDEEDSGADGWPADRGPGGAGGRADGDTGRTTLPDANYDLKQG